MHYACFLTQYPMSQNIQNPVIYSPWNSACNKTRKRMKVAFGLKNIFSDLWIFPVSGFYS